MPPPRTFDELLQQVYHLHRSGRFDEAAKIYRELLRLKPNNAVITGLLGLLRREQGQWEESERLLEKACRLGPENAFNHVQWGLVLKELGRPADAAAAFERAYALEPAYPYVLSELFQVSQSICDWRHFDRNTRGMAEAARTGTAVVEPFVLLHATDNGADLLAGARARVAEGIEQHKHLMPPSPYVHAPVRREGKIRVAYRSADFQNHPTTHLICELIELHDRLRFEIVALSMGPDDGSAYRRRLEATFDRFIHVLDWPVNEIVQRMRALDIDILVDLMGHTRFGFMHHMARRPAKIQVNFLGYPGTAGADFMDYVIADPFVVPPEHETFFSEQVVRLPGSYQVNDRRRPLGEAAPARGESGLPAEGFVFCCFNHAGKINPPVFDVWMRLLREIPGSVLWLLDPGEHAAGNLRREAAARGVGPASLVFAPKVPLADHIARHRLADLCLDTLPYNAHTTASDALWAGVPFVTCPGRSFAARVCGSLLTAAGVPELIAASLAEYESLALTLARDPARLAELRRRLAEGREHAPLFDTPRFCRHLEQAFETMAEIQRSGEKPRAFTVEGEGSDAGRG